MTVKGVHLHAQQANSVVRGSFHLSTMPFSNLTLSFPEDYICPSGNGMHIITGCGCVLGSILLKAHLFWLKGDESEISLTYISMKF